MDDRFSNDGSTQKPYVKYKPLKINNELKPVARVPGTPPTWECLFLAIQNNQTNGSAFTWLRRLLNRYSDEDVWKYYEFWLDKKVHPDICK